MSLLGPTLEAFLAVSKNKTVHGAAVEIGLTQTGVTQRIRTLEKEVNSTLFIRSRRGMLLTAQGHALVRFCLGVKELEKQTLPAFIGAGIEFQARVLIVGPTSIITARVIPQCVYLYAKFPQLQLNFEVNDKENLSELLRQGVADFVIVPPDQVAREMDSKVLKGDKYIVVGSPTWKGRVFKKIVSEEKIIDFYESDQTTFRYLKRFELYELANKERIFINNNDALIALLKKGVGYGTLIEEVAKPHLDRNELIVLNHKSSVLDDPLALAWYPRTHPSEYFKQIIQSIK